MSSVNSGSQGSFEDGPKVKTFNTQSPSSMNEQAKF
jgi:hypothetical protein